MAINAFDSNGYMLKVNLFLSKCSDYQNLQSLKEKLKEDPAFYAECAAILGPNQPGITQADPSYTGAQEKDAGHHLPASKRSRKKDAAGAPNAPEGPARSRTRRQKEQKDPKRKAAEELVENLEDTLGIDLPDLPPANLPDLGPVQGALPQNPSAADAQGLLDFLLGP